MTDKCFMLQCIFCKEKYDEKDLKRCGNYCSKECQVVHWKVHKLYCKDSKQKIPEKYFCVDNTSHICECMDEKIKYRIEASSKGICPRVGCGKEVNTERGIKSCWSFDCEHNPFFSMMGYFCSLACQLKDFRSYKQKEIAPETLKEIKRNIERNEMIDNT